MAESLVTLGAHEGLFSGVKATVFREVVLVFESLGTYVASEWSTTCNRGNCISGRV